MKKAHRLIGLVSLVVITILVLTGCTSSGTPAGVSDASISTDGHLVLKFSDGKTIDAGNVIAGQNIDNTFKPVTSFIEIIPHVEESMVRIDVTLENGTAAGSGCIMDKRGYLITNQHVIDGAKSINVTLHDGTVLGAGIIASDSNQDLAILKIDSARTDFTARPMGNISDVVVGEEVIIAGFPGGTDLSGPVTFTSGIVSAIREFSGTKYIQTDATINPGNSGGCMFISNGNMIGIPTAGLTPPNEDYENIGLAIPIDQVEAYFSKYVK